MMLKSLDEVMITELYAEVMLTAYFAVVLHHWSGSKIEEGPCLILVILRVHGYGVRECIVISSCHFMLLWLF